MDLVKFKREQEYHIQHVERVRNVKRVINTDTPNSLGLKHLATRPKKQQLIDDRQQAIAKENRKLMERMTVILSGANKTNKPYKKPPSLNEKARRLAVDKLNAENAELVKRLRSVPSVLDVDALERDFQRHKTIGGQLRRRQMVPSSLTPSSPPSGARRGDGSTFDSARYIAQHTGSVLMTQSKEDSLLSSSLLSNTGEKVLGGTGEMDTSVGKISTMQDFRKQVISKKVLAQQKGGNSSSTPNMTASLQNQNKKLNMTVEFSHNPEF